MNEWYLESQNSAMSGNRHAVKGHLFSIGRAMDNALVLGSKHVSRKHAVISLRDGKLMLRDMNSTNGTLINGETFEGSEEIFHDDVLSFGSEEFRLVCAAMHAQLPQQDVGYFNSQRM